MVREVSRNKEQYAKFSGNLLAIQAVLAALIWVLIGLIAWSFNFAHDTKVILILIGGYHVFYRLFGLFGSIFMAYEQMQYPALLESAHKIAILFLGMLAIWVWDSPILALAAYPISGFAMVLLAFVLCITRYGWPDLSLDLPFIKNLIWKLYAFFCHHGARVSFMIVLD